MNYAYMSLRVLGWCVGGLHGGTFIAFDLKVLFAPARDPSPTAAPEPGGSRHARLRLHEQAQEAVGRHGFPLFWELLREVLLGAEETFMPALQRDKGSAE